jgi:hypothetical protein
MFLASSVAWVRGTAAAHSKRPAPPAGPLHLLGGLLDGRRHLFGAGRVQCLSQGDAPEQRELWGAGIQGWIEGDVCHDLGPKQTPCQTWPDATNVTHRGLTHRRAVQPLRTPTGTASSTPPVVRLTGHRPRFGRRASQKSGKASLLCQVWTPSIGAIFRLKGSGPPSIGAISRLKGSGPSLIGAISCLKGSGPSLIGAISRLKGSGPSLIGAISCLKGSGPPPIDSSSRFG